MIYAVLNIIVVRRRHRETMHRLAILRSASRRDEIVLLVFVCVCVNITCLLFSYVQCSPYCVKVSATCSFGGSKLKNTERREEGKDEEQTSADDADGAFANLL